MAALALTVVLCGSLLHGNLQTPVDVGNWLLDEAGGFLAGRAGVIVWLLRRFPRSASQ